MDRSDRPRHRARPPAVVIDPVLGWLGLLAIMIVIWYGLDLGGRIAQVVLCWLCMLFLHAMLIVMAWRVAKRPQAPPPTRRLWGTLALTGGLYAAGDLAQFVTIVNNPYSVQASLGDMPQATLVLIGTVLLVGVMLTSPLGLASRRERSRFWLDAATVMAAAATYGFWIMLRPRRLDLGGWAAEVTFTVLLGPAIFLVGVFAVVKLILGGQPPFTRPAGVVFGLAAGMEAILQAVPEAWRLAPGAVRWLLAAHLLASLLLTVAARVQQLQARGALFVFWWWPKRPYSVLPYAAIAATYLLLVVALAKAGLTGFTWVVVIGAILSTALVVGRQLSAFRHIAELLLERDALAAQLTFQAFHDSLTGLANRPLFLQRLDEALDRPPELRVESDEVAVVMVDLDDFKPVNDQLGHAAGDEVLVQVSGWLRDCVREGDTVARLGGDEFAVLADGMPAGGWAAVAQRITDAMRRPALIGDVEVRIHASVGVAVGRRGVHGSGQLLHRADVAMYLAKDRGKGTYEIVNDATPSRDRLRASLQTFSQAG